ncbi:MAG: 2-oxoglutarate:ferredoxin oxidoreductase [Nitrospirae bacterium]|nr:MAG: 2-oxoglutarate:ferredoxin oxidoreductase [Nitrospirota bacterium]
MHETTTDERIIVPGPAGFHPPSAAQLGVLPPNPGKGLLYGREVDEETVMEEIARVMLTGRNATIFPGPLVLWNWNAHAAEKARAVLEIAAQIPDVLIIPMPDYRPKYPKVEPQEVINPNHPNLTIWGNKIEACIFVGVHCHYANLSLKMIRAGTNCCTIALCAEQGHEDAMMTVRDCDAAKLRSVAQVIKRVREEMGIALPENGENVRFTPYQSRMVHGGKTHTNPLDFTLSDPTDGSAAAFGHSSNQMQREA